MGERGGSGYAGRCRGIHNYVQFVDLFTASKFFTSSKWPGLEVAGEVAPIFALTPLNNSTDVRYVLLFK